MKRSAEASALLGALLAEFESRVDAIEGQSSLVVAAFTEAQPEAAPAVPSGGAPAQPGPAGRPPLRIRIPERVRSRLSTAERREAAMPVDSPDPVVRSLMVALNGYHLWLLADAVDAVSRYYRSLFATLGYLDSGLWPCSCYGDLRMNEVEAKPPAWFQGRAAAFMDSQGMIGVADALASAVPALKHGAEVRTPPGVWFRGAGLLMKLLVDRHGSVPESTLEEWFRGAGMEANEALRVMGVLSCIRVQGGDATLWLIDAAQGDDQLTKRFKSLLGRAQECVSAGHVAAMEHFGVAAAPPPPRVMAPQSRPVPAAAQQKQAVQNPAAPAEVPKGRDPSFVPIKLQEPAGRYRPVKGSKI